MSVLRERGVVRDRIVQIQPTKPPIGEVEMYLLTQPPFRANSMSVSDDQHPEHQFWIDGRTANPTIVRLKPPAHLSNIDEAINAPQQMICGNMILNVKLVKEADLQSLPLTHHRWKPLLLQRP